jgi:predicted nucleotide-binding protein (sugar kinase/HSP70/actin superfamily)
MNKEEILKAFPSYEEMTKEEFDNSGFNNGYISIYDDSFDDKRRFILHLKPKRKFPIVFEDDVFEFKVYEDNSIAIKIKEKEIVIFVKESLPLLEQVMDTLKEVRKRLEK